MEIYQLSATDLAKKIKMLVDEGLNVKVIAKVVDLSRYNVAKYIKKHEMK